VLRNTVNHAIMVYFSEQTQPLSGVAGSQPCSFLRNHLCPLHSPSCNIYIYDECITFCTPKNSRRVTDLTFSKNKNLLMADAIATLVRPVPWDGSFTPLPPYLSQPSQLPKTESVAQFLCERCRAFSTKLEATQRLKFKFEKTWIERWVSAFSESTSTPFLFTKPGTNFTNLMKKGVTYAALFF
jgi:hypothetical protein